MEIDNAPELIRAKIKEMLLQSNKETIEKIGQGMPPIMIERLTDLAATIYRKGLEDGINLAELSIKELKESVK